MAQWIPVTGGDAAKLERELARELPDGQVLKALAVRAVARRDDGDDVVFETADGRRCVVHLTWSVEADPRWPRCEFVTEVAEVDVPLRVDFRDPETARTWVEQTRITKPFRPNFFATFCAALAGRPRVRILELGSGPGQLAREILRHADVATYVALDWSQAMHDLAAAHLGDPAARVTFVVRDFREPTWPQDLGAFDAIVTMQAAHETRHRRHLVPLLERARSLLVPGGMLLYSDGYLHPGTTLPALSLSRDDQHRALERAGFVDVVRLHDEGHQALYRATNP